MVIFASLGTMICMVPRAPLRFVLVALILALSACASSAPPKAEPPQGSIGELRIDPADGLLLELHLQNISEVSIRANRLTVTLTSDNAVQRFSYVGAIVVPMLGGERITLKADGAPAWLDRLGGLGRAEELSFELSGELVQDSGQVLKLAYEGRLSPTPGKPGSFR